MYAFYELEEPTITVDKWNRGRNCRRYMEVRANLKRQWEVITLLMDEYRSYVWWLHCRFTW
jgi:hypothetical protein